MKILTLHVDYIEWEGLKKALKNIDEISKENPEKRRVEEALVVLTAIEKGDFPENIEEYVKNIKEISESVKAKKIVLYPYAHLSRNLGSPETAVEILKKAEEELKKLHYEVYRAPFGYYKTFELKVKGHPLSELSREIISRIEDVEAPITEKEVKALLREISKSKLDTSKLEDNDHRILGKKMDLWSFNPVAPGMVFWHDKGLTIKNELINYWREVHKRENYQEISTPQIMDSKLWKVSGHWDKYKENNFVTSYEKRPFLAKPMNCPGGMLVYNAQPKSYKDLPLRVGEMGVVHRVELSGVLSGLFRVIQFTQDDAHIFCANDSQVKEEIFGVMEIIQELYKTFKLEFDHVELSTRPEKRIGSDKDWDTAEALLEKALKEKKIKYKVNEGDGAFYGPKIDFHLKDSLGRTWQASTIQLDFSLPERFNLKFTDEGGNEKRPIMLHRVIYGSLERFIGIITESYSGNFPLWLSPVQVRILPMSEKNNKFAEKVKEKFVQEGLRVEVDYTNESLGKKVRTAQLERVFYMVTVGDKEEAGKTISVRSRDGSLEHGLPISKFIKRMKKEIEGRK
ncbi:MAG: threonine--tRNA ligase [Nanoarchaeota archaeon]|nr:threonine--tRNA ligase [Nanoarchaeota archaeon]